MTVKYVVQATSPGQPDLILYATKRYRSSHEGALSSKPSAAILWDSRRAAERRAECERIMLPNRLYGHLVFTVKPVHPVESKQQ